MGALPLWVPAVGGGPHEPGRVVRGAEVPVPRAEEDVVGAWAPGWLGVAAGAPAVGVHLEVAGEELLEEGGHIGRPYGTVFRPAAVETGVELVELPGDLDGVAADATWEQADGFAPAHAGVRLRDHHHEGGVVAGQG